MLFDHIKGHENKLSFLEGLLVKGDLNGPFIFAGSEAIGKRTIAVSTAKYLTCLSSEKDYGCRCSNCRSFPNIPDYMVIDQGDKIITVETVDSIDEFSALAPFNSKGKVVLINNADKMNSYAFNRLLKILETDNKSITYLLVSSNPEDLDPTIKSRCRYISFGNLSVDHIVEIMTKYNNSTANVEFIKGLSPFISRGVLSSYNDYLQVSKSIPGIIRSVCNNDEHSIHSKIDELDSEGYLNVFIDLITAYVNDILKTHYGSTKFLVFKKDMESIESATEVLDVDSCLGIISRVRDCRAIDKKGLNLKIKSNLKSAFSWACILLNKKNEVKK